MLIVGEIFESISIVDPFDVVAAFVMFCVIEEFTIIVFGEVTVGFVRFKEESIDGLV